MEKHSKKKRKSKGNLSVLDEFTGDAGVIEFQPRISINEQARIDERTRLADIPNSILTKIQNSNASGFNLGQTSDKPETEPRTIVGQTSDKLRTNLRQYKHTQTDTSDKSKTEPRTNPRTIVGQTSDKLRTISAFQALSGLQKNIVLLIYDLCRIKGDRVTGPVSIEYFYLKLESTRLSVQKSIQRLEQKTIIIRKEFRSGRGGWTIYELPENVWSEILQSETSDKLRTNLGQSSDNPKTEPRTEPRTNLPCSSSNLNIKETTTTADPDLSFSLPKNLAGLVHVKQLREFIRQGLVTEEVMQTSLDGFAYDLEGGVIKAKTGNPIAILIGAIKQGGYVSQKYLEELKSQLAEVEKSRAEMQQIQAQGVSEQLKKEFESFRQSHPELAEKFKPSDKFFKAFEPGSIGYKLWLDEYKTQKDLVPLPEEPEPTP